MRCDLSLRTPTERKHDPDAINRAMERDGIGGATVVNSVLGLRAEIDLLATFDGNTFFCWNRTTQRFIVMEFELPLKQ